MIMLFVNLHTIRAEKLIFIINALYILAIVDLHVTSSTIVAFVIALKNPICKIVSRL